MKKILMFSLILVLVLVACSQEETQEVLQEMTFMVPSEAASLDPNFSNETYGSIVIQHMYEGLVRIDEEGKIVPAAAESFTVTDQNTTFTFKLRENLKWSDGQPVTADHFRNAWLRFMDPELSSVNASVISPYILNLDEYLKGEADLADVGIYVLDDYTFQVKTKVSTPFLVDILTHNLFFPVRLDAVEKDPENWSKNPDYVITNGPFVLSDYKPNEYFVLKKNDQYWDADAIHLDTLTFSLRSTEDDIAELYNSNQLDGSFEITTKEINKISNGELHATSTILPSTAFMTFNHDNDLMSDVRFRQAVSIALDREGVVNEVLSGAGIPTRYLVPIIYKINGQSLRDFTELDPGVELDKARSLIQELKDEGVFNGRTITFHYMDNGPDALVSEYLMKKLSEDLDLDIELIALPWADLYNLSLNEDYDMLMMGWGADYPHPMTFLSAMQRDSFYGPITRWQDDAYEQAIDDFLLITDEQEALEALRDIEDLVLDEYHIAPVYYRKGLALVSQNIKGWYRSTFFNFTRARIEEQ